MSGKKDGVLRVNPGVLLLLCAAVAVVFASVPWGGWFERMWEAHIDVHAGGFVLDMSVRHWVNDALMAVFFFVVGLEIKREMLFGQLSSLKKSALPVFAAVGGMLVPALVYLGFNGGRPEYAHGWGIPMATDIAFAIGVLSLLGSRVPLGVKVFLTALAIVDDLGAIVVLAVFYPTHALHVDFLAYAAVVLVVLGLFNRLKVGNKWLYLVPGVLLWYFVLRSGVHATIAGVLWALVIPARGREDSLMARLEHRLQPVVNYGIMPVFALANAGVALDFSRLFDGGMASVSLGIFLGLFVGKPLGIFLFSFLGIRLGLADKPEGITWRQLVAAGMLGGIGFTMSIFINNLAFTEEALVDVGKISILVTSVVAAVAGLVAMRLACKPFREDNKDNSF